MSGCILIIWGAVLPLTAPAESIKAAEDERWIIGDISMDKPYGGPCFLQPYSGNGVPAWFAGVVLATLRQYSFPKDGYMTCTLDPTDEQRRQAEGVIAKLPEVIRKALTPVGRYILPCP